MEIIPQMAADELLRRKHLPEEWKWCLVKGKDAFGQGTSTDPLDTETTLAKVKTRHHRQTGLGVITGDKSGGLVDLDIDGLTADEFGPAAAEWLLKKKLGDDYPDSNDTMSWRGSPGRRHLLYQIPEDVRPLLKDFTKQEMFPILNGTSEEVKVRYNKMYSVIPGSLHPGTGKPYEWINYNNGKVADAPDWLIEFMLSKVESPPETSSFLPKEFLEKTAHTEYSYAQMRRIFWGDKELKDGGLWRLLAENDEYFKQVYYAECWEDGNQPLQLENAQKNVWRGGSPFRLSQSGTSFTVFKNFGNFYCHAEDKRGDAIQLLHALNEQDINAGDPSPIVLEKYLRQICGVVGKRFPEDFREAQLTKEVKKYDPTTGPNLLVVARDIIKKLPNPAEQDLELLLLADQYGVRKDADQIRLLIQEDEDYKRSGDTLDADARRALITGTDWLIPDVLKRPSTVLLHGDGGCGKSLACQVLAKHIGRGIPFKVRGAEMPVKTGPVLWCNADQSLETLEEQLEAQGIQNERWFHVLHDFRLRHVQRLAAFIRKLKPVLVIIDSLAASQPTIDGNKQIVSAPLYWLEANNGVAFPKCTFVVIHHNNKQGGFRGHSSIRDAVSETWSIAKPTDQEMEQNLWGDDTFRRRMITIGKSRSGREGDRLVTLLHEDFTMDLEDYTDAERVRPGGSVSVYDRVHVAIRSGTDSGEALRRSEIKVMVNADGGRPASDSAIRKSLQRLEAREMIAAVQAPIQNREGEGGTPEKAYVAKTANGVAIFESLLSISHAGGASEVICPTGKESSGGEGLAVGQGSGTSSGTTASGASKLYQPLPNEGTPETDFTVSDELDQTGLDRCTHSQWDKQEAVPLLNPVTDREVPSGTIFEDIEEIDLEESPDRQPPAPEDLY